MRASRIEFEGIFGAPSRASASAPGRVNLLGEHTDYNGGFVLPTPIPQLTTVEIGPGVDEDEFYSASLNEHVRLSRSTLLPGFARYISGCIRTLEQVGIAVPPVRIFVHSDVPIGAGLSSSAALEVATLRALDECFGFRLNPVRLATLAQLAEVQYGGVACGIMDQMACSLGRPRTMLFLDTRTLEHRLLPLPSGSEIVVIDSGLSRQLALSAYNSRKAECDAAAKALGVPQLRDITDDCALTQLPSPLRQRAAHVVSENARVLKAIEANAAIFGDLMNESHWSLSRDYEVSVPAIDELVGWLQHQEGAFGARMTGAGFGGACVALVQSGYASEMSRRLPEFKWDHPLPPRIIVPRSTHEP